MEFPPTLSEPYKKALQQGRIKDVMDLFTHSPAELSKRCRISPSDLKIITNLYCKHLVVAPRTLGDVLEQQGGDQKFTTGDEGLDRVLGGGIRTGIVWEFVGQSASGKTQLALQLSMLVQLPRMLGGISGSTCYITTKNELETRRLVALRDAHPLLSPSVCTLDDIQTVKATTVPLLQMVLKEMLSELIVSRNADLEKKPVKLVVLDSITDFFPSEKTSSTTLAERSKSLTEIAASLHRIARHHQIAVIVLNGIGEVFSYEGRSDDGGMGSQKDLIYRDQSQWFSRAHSIYEERKREASLGLVWANQVNVRVMFTRTTRQRLLKELEEPTAKRRRIDSPSGSSSQSNSVPSPSITQDAVLLRRLTVIFSSVAEPGSADFMLTEAGLCAPAAIQTTEAPKLTNAVPPAQVLNAVASLDTGTEKEKGSQEDDSDWDGLWKEDDEFYDNLDLTAPL